MNEGQPATIMDSNSEVAVEVVPSVPFFAGTCTKPGLKSNGDSWVGVGNGRDGLLDNEYKGADSCLDYDFRMQVLAVTTSCCANTSSFSLSWCFLFSRGWQQQNNCRQQ